MVIDKVGTRIGVTVEKNPKREYFTHRIWNVLAQAIYKFEEGAWLQMVYKGDNVFAMRVENIEHVK